MPSREQLLRHVKAYFGEARDNGQDLQVNCPFCATTGRGPDKGFKLYISHTRDAYHCFRCDAKGRTSRLIPQLDFNVYGLEAAARVEERELEELPRYYRLGELPESHVARVFIQKRGFTLAEATQRVLYCEDYRKSNFSFGPRIIFPIYQFGTYRGFQARALDDREPKYVGASGMTKKTILYNYDVAFEQTKELVIVEGFFDQWKVGPTAVAAMGKAVSDEQLRLIRLGRFDRVIILLDKDAKKEIMETSQKISRYFTTYVGFLPDKDPGAMTTEALRLFLDTQVERVF